MLVLLNCKYHDSWSGLPYNMKPTSSSPSAVKFNYCVYVSIYTLLAPSRGDQKWEINVEITTTIISFLAVTWNDTDFPKGWLGICNVAFKYFKRQHFENLFTIFPFIHMDAGVKLGTSPSSSSCLCNPLKWTDCLCLSVVFLIEVNELIQILIQTQILVSDWLSALSSVCSPLNLLNKLFLLHMT